MPPHNQFQLVNPFREPSWRHQRILELIERDPPGRVSSRDDEWVREYRRFMGKIRRAEDAESQMALFPKYPGQFLAYLFHHQPDKEWRWLLQARILTGTDFESVARRMMTIPSAVFWYEKMFFNVEDRLEADDYIVKMVIGKPEDRILSSRDGVISDMQEQINYKLFGYFGGTLLLDVMFSGFLKRRPKPERVDQVDDWQNQSWTTMIGRKALSAARHFQVNKYNVMQLFELQARIIEAAKSAGGSITEFERNVAAVLNEIPWELNEARKQRLGESQKTFNVTAVEPRASEMMELAQGRSPRKLLRDKKLRILPPDAE
jgi:hypothetical protein